MRRTTTGLLAAVAAATFTFQVSAADTPAHRGGPPGAPMMFQRLDRNHDGKITADEVPDGAPEFVKETLKQADKDGDKTITAEEFRGSLQRFHGGPPGATPHAVGPRVGTAPPHGPGPHAPGAALPGFRPDPKAVFARLDKDGDQKLSLDEFTAGMKMFHAPAMAARRPMMGRRPLGPPPGMWRPPMWGPRGPWGPPAWARAPWARHAWAHAARHRPPMAGPGAAWARPRGPMTGHAPAILARLRAADKDKDGKLSKSEAPERLRLHFDKVDANKDGQLDKAELGKAVHALGQQAREAMAKHRGEVAKKMGEARAKAVERLHAAKHEAEKRRGEAEKHIDKKIEEKKKADEKKSVESKRVEKKPVEKKVEEKRAEDKKS